MVKILEGVTRASQCSRCSIWFSYDKSDCTEDPDRDGVYLVINCPACNARNTVGVK